MKSLSRQLFDETARGVKEEVVEVKEESPVKKETCGRSLADEFDNNLESEEESEINDFLSHDGTESKTLCPEGPAQHTPSLVSVYSEDPAEV